MSMNSRDPLALGYAFGDQLKGKSRRRRERLARLAAASAGSHSVRNDVLPPLELVHIAPKDLRTLARKLRKIDPAHVREVASSVSSLRFCDPVLIGKNNLVLDGEIRLEAAKLLGLSTVPCVRVDHLTEGEQRTLRLAINRLGEKGQWNLDELKIEFEELILADAPIESSGFSVDEIDHIRLDEGPGAKEAGPLEPQPGSISVTGLGDVFRLGDHRIICGDATDSTVMARLMDGDAPARLILTDEPYNVPVAGHVTGGVHREFAMASGEMSNDQFLAFNTSWMNSALPHLCDGGVFGTFIDWRGHPIVCAAAAQLRLTPLNLVVWAKTNAGIGSLYRSQHELLPLFKKGEAPHINNVELGRKGRWRSNVWTYPGASSLGSDARRGLVEHPTVKPTAMLEDALLDLTNRGDIVLDPFLGSGSTLIAADKARRICRGVELDPLYIDVIIRRFEAATGKVATHDASGESFAALAERRCRETKPRP
jgi:DNA modification methylase